MKAIIMTSPGDPDVLQLQEIPDPQIQHNTEILVRLKAAGINPIDTKLRKRGTFYPDQMPAVLGCDGAGIVEAIAPGVQSFQVGDEVYFCNAGLGGHPGNYAELAVVDQRFVAHKPKSLSFAEAAAAPLVLITAWEALQSRSPRSRTKSPHPRWSRRRRTRRHSTSKTYRRRSCNHRQFPRKSRICAPAWSRLSHLLQPA
jgi:NADPH:quinone reductase